LNYVWGFCNLKETAGLHRQKSRNMPSPKGKLSNPLTLLDVGRKPRKVFHPMSNPLLLYKYATQNGWLKRNYGRGKRSPYL
jgi:hypothetical protein